MKPNELQFKQFGKPRGKTVMQIVGSKLLLTTASSNISLLVSSSGLRLRMVVVLLLKR